MKIHLFSVNEEHSSRSLNEVLDQISDLALSEREKVINSKIIFLESVEKRDDGRYLLDFTWRRMENGPGLSKPGAETEDIEMGSEDGFGEQTAIAYCPTTKLATVQYNHQGAKHSLIADYLSAFGTNQTDVFSFSIVINQNTQNRLEQASEVTRLEYLVDARMLETDTNSPTVKGLLNTRQEVGAKRIAMQISIEESRRSGNEGALALLRQLLSDDATENLRAGIKDDEDSEIEMLNLFKHKVYVDIDNDRLVKTTGRRYTLASRLQHLNYQLTKWNNQYSTQQ